MFNLFSKKKKKFSATCDLSRTPLDKASAYVVSTAQIISSRKFWDNIMTEPETMTYTEAYFKSGDKTATNIRTMIFKKYANEDKAWVISDAQIHLFDIDLDESKKLGDQWWDSEGNEVPDHLRSSISSMDESEFESLQNYAIHDAGKHLVKFWG